MCAALRCTLHLTVPASIPLVQETATTTPWSRPAASLLTAGWQIAEFQERIEFLEMDKELLVHEREGLCKTLSEQSKQIEELEQHLQSLRILDQRRAHEDEARESCEARAYALREEVRHVYPSPWSKLLLDRIFS